jgi:hypothetical protein
MPGWAAYSVRSIAHFVNTVTRLLLSDFCPAGKNLKEASNMPLREWGCLRIVAPSGTLRGVRQVLLTGYRWMR